jgi:hypothetical protein
MDLFKLVMKTKLKIIMNNTIELIWFGVCCFYWGFSFFTFVNGITFTSVMMFLISLFLITFTFFDLNKEKK